VNLQWDVKGTVDLITITRGGSILWDGAPLRGSLQDCPPGTGSVGYTLVAKGPGGQSTAQQYVNVATPATAVPPTAAPPTSVPPTATSTPQPPAIVGKNWLLTAYTTGQGGLVAPIAGTQITARFGSDGTVSGTDSCNNYTAPYTVSRATELGQRAGGQSNLNGCPPPARPEW
jgi:hypothetical protein